jgi:chitodextrinase
MPQAPTNLQYHNLQQTQVTLYWDHDTSAGAVIEETIISYVAEDPASSNQFNNDAKTIKAGGDVTFKLIEDLKPETKYQFKIATKANTGQSAFTSPITLTTATGLPAEPIILKLVN